MARSRRTVKSLWQGPSGRQRPALGLGAGLLAFGVAACMGQDTGQYAGLAGPGGFQVARAAEGSLPSSPLGNYLAGTFAIDQGELKEAALFFERALAGSPDNVELQQQLFMLTLAAGEFDQALGQARHLLEQNQAADEIKLLLALERVRNGDFDGAREILNGLGRTGIAGLALPFLDAWVRFGAGGPDAVSEAVARLEAGESLGPLNDYHSAMLLDLGGREAEALEVMGGAMPEAGLAPLRMIQAHASMLARAGRSSEAIEQVQAQLEDGLEPPVVEDVLDALRAGRPPARPFADAAGGLADALLGIAEALHQERGGARAVVYARLATYVHPELAEGFLLIGDIMAEQRNYAAAAEAYREIAAGSPFERAAGLRTARVLHAMDSKDEAYTLLEELARSDRGRIEALVQLGDLLRREEAYARAEGAYSRAVERIEDPERQHWTLFYARGITFERTKRWPEAEADFLQALELEPEQPFVLNYLGYSWVDQGMHLDRAKGMLNRAVELRPNDGFIVDSLGWVHYRLGEYRAAVDRLERAVELEPGDPVINDHLGDAYWRVGRQREARYQWERALSLDPDDDVIAEIRKKLRSGLPEKDPEIDRT